MQKNTISSLPRQLRHVLYSAPCANSRCSAPSEALLIRYLSNDLHWWVRPRPRSWSHPVAKNMCVQDFTAVDMQRTNADSKAKCKQMCTRTISVRGGHFSGYKSYKILRSCTIRNYPLPIAIEPEPTATTSPCVRPGHPRFCILQYQCCEKYVLNRLNLRPSTGFPVTALARCEPAPEGRMLIHYESGRQRELPI